MEKESALNTTSSTSQKEECFVLDPIPLKMVRICAYCIVIFVSLTGNLLIIVVTRRIKMTQRKSIHYLIVNMAVADIFLTLYMPRVVSLVYAGFEWQVDGIPGELFCRVSTLLNQTCMAASILTVVAISFDRFLAILFPLRTSLLTIPRTKLLITLIWLIASAFRFPMVYAASLNNVDRKQHCYIQLDETFGDGTAKIYYFVNLLCLFAAPFLAILILYSAIIVTLKRRKLPKPENAFRMNSWQQRKEETTRKVLSMVAAVVIAFLCCWLLYFIRLILFSYDVDVSCNIQFVRLFLAHSNSAINPCLYVAFSENYRCGVKMIFSRLYSLQDWCRNSYILPAKKGTGNSKTVFHEQELTAAGKSTFLQICHDTCSVFTMETISLSPVLRNKKEIQNYFSTKL